MCPYCVYGTPKCAVILHDRRGIWGGLALGMTHSHVVAVAFFVYMPHAAFSPQKAQTLQLIPRSGLTHRRLWIPDCSVVTSMEIHFW
jgi:hypothetical protein